MTSKYHQLWVILKTTIDRRDNRPSGYKAREIWWIHLGVNIGFEEDGKGEAFVRPVLVLKVFSRQLFWGIPLTTNHKKGEYYFTFDYNDKRSTAILSQLRAFDSKRLSRKIGEINRADYFNLVDKLKDLI